MNENLTCGFCFQPSSIQASSDEFWDHFIGELLQRTTFERFGSTFRLSLIFVSESYDPVSECLEEKELKTM
jgi:hypothetical protein